MRFIILGAILIVGYVAVYAGAVIASKDRITEELVAAVEASDSQAAMARLDLPAIRAFLKSDLKKKSRAVRSGKVNVPVGPSPEEVDEIVDFYVQPEKIDMLMGLRSKVFPDNKAADFVRNIKFRSPFSFSITVGYPSAGHGQQPTFSETMSSVTFVFTAHGWSWKATEMHVPLFLVPRETFHDAEIEQLLSQPNPRL